MEKEFEIGQKVKWCIGKLRLRGLYIDKIDDNTSSVKCYSRNEQRYICTVKVMTNLLEEDTE
jgi:hypothetical protein